MENEDLKKEGWENQELPKRKRRGRPKKEEQEKEQLKQEEIQEREKLLKIKKASDLIKVGLTTGNELLFRSLPADLKKEGFEPLTETEILSFTGSLVTVLDKYNKLDIDEMPEISLIVVSITIILPRYRALKRYRTEKNYNKKEETETPEGGENDNTGKN